MFLDYKFDLILVSSQITKFFLQIVLEGTFTLQVNQ